MTEKPTPLSAEEETTFRRWLADSEGDATFGHGIAALNALPRLLATLDAARATVPAGPEDVEAEAFDRESLAMLDDLTLAVELADTRTTAVKENPDGTVERYSLSASDWNRIVAIARGSKSEAAERAIAPFRAARPVPAAAAGKRESIPHSSSGSTRRGNPDGPSTAERPCTEVEPDDERPVPAAAADLAAVRRALAVHLDREPTDEEVERASKSRGWTVRMNDYEGRLRAWAGCVDRLMAVAPVSAVIDETGIEARGHSTPPERKAIRDEARATVARWLARDLTALGSTGDDRLREALERIRDTTLDQPAAVNVPDEDWFRRLLLDAMATARTALAAPKATE